MGQDLKPAPSETPAELALTDALLDSVAAAVRDELEPPSRIARRAKVATHEAQRALAWLARRQFVVASGNGAWTNYRQRRAGEVVR